MARPLTFSLTDYPQLEGLITNQSVQLNIIARVGLTVMSGVENTVTLLPVEIEVIPQQRPSVQDVLLAKIVEHTGMNMESRG